MKAGLRGVTKCPVVGERRCYGQEGDREEQEIQTDPGDLNRKPGDPNREPRHLRTHIVGTCLSPWGMDS